mgnify:CR=1 FL=1
MDNIGNCGGTYEKIKEDQSHRGEIPAEKIEEAAKEMLKRKTSGLLVIDLKTGTLEGIFCESDIVRKVISRGLNPSQTPVRAAMTIKPTTLNTETTKPLDALNLMLEKRFRHLPVADNDNRATGLHSILNLTFEVLGSRFISCLAVILRFFFV